MKYKDIQEQLKVFDYIRFVEDGHKYFGHGDQPMVSVSKFKSWAVRPFNAEIISKVVASRRGVTQESILEEWEKKKFWGTTRGSAVHKFIENSLQDIEEDVVLDDWVLTLPDLDIQQYLDELDKCQQQFMNFLADHPHLTPVGTEVVVGDPDWQMCGTFDQLFWNSITERIELWDWKTDSNLKLDTKDNLINTFKRKKATKINIYTIQLNTYRLFLNKYTDLDVQDMNICHFHADNDNYRVFNIENWEELVKEGLDEYYKSNIVT